MNKLAGFGVAVALCMAAAGFGAYLALRPQPAAVPVAAIGEAVVPAAQMPAAAEVVDSPADLAGMGSAPAPAAARFALVAAAAPA
jgi:hypothetical protein